MVFIINKDFISFQIPYNHITILNKPSRWHGTLHFWNYLKPGSFALAHILDFWNYLKSGSFALVHILDFWRFSAIFRDF
jgi:hypothetical protein